MLIQNEIAKGGALNTHNTHFVTRNICRMLITFAYLILVLFDEIGE